MPSPTKSAISSSTPWEVDSRPVQVLDYKNPVTELDNSETTVTMISPYSRRVPSVPKPDQEKETDWVAKNAVLLIKRGEQRKQAVLDMRRSWDKWFQERDQVLQERAKKRRRTAE